MRNHQVMDYETISNCFVACFEHYKTDEVKVFVIHQLRNDYKDFISFLEENKKNKDWHISFNGLSFDSQITEHIFSNKAYYESITETPNGGDLIAKNIYAYAQKVIDKQDRKQFSDYPSWKLSIRQLDLFKMNHWDNPAKSSSLKWIQYSMDWFNIQEMPIHHTETIYTLEQIDEIISYCINDVKSTKNIMNLCKDQIKLRETLSKEYDIDLFSASEPRISKELFMYFLVKKIGIEKHELKNLRTIRREIYLKDCIIPTIQFETEVFQKVLEYFKSKVITNTKGEIKYSIDYMGVKTDYGLGGIHGAISSGIYEAKDGYIIMTSDVTSFYPNLAIKNGFSPAHLPTAEFLEQYAWFFNERILIPKSDPKNYVYKIILNSTYGLSNDENSFLYDPMMTMQITINGQLWLSKLYEMLSTRIKGSIPLMQNTDGLEMMIPVQYKQQYLDICAEWEQMTNLALEHDEYSKMIIGDVNNYIAVYKPKEVDEESYNKSLTKTPHYVHSIRDDKFYITKTKCKGRFEFTDLALHKNKSFLIIPKALYNYFVKGINPEQTIKENKNLFDYCAGIKAKGDWQIEIHEIVNSVPNRFLNMTIQEKRDYLKNNGWEESWSEDNWVKSTALNKEANTGLSTDHAFRITVGKEAVLQKTKLQKINRYFISKKGIKILKVHKDGRVIQIEAGKWMQTVCNDISPFLKMDFDTLDIDYSYYINSIEKEILNITNKKTDNIVQGSLFQF